MIQSGRVFSLAAILIFFVIYLYCIRRSLQGRIPTIRKLAGLEGIREVTARSVEMGRPIVYSTGTGTLRAGADMPQTLAGLTLLGHVSKLAASYKVKAVYWAAVPELVPLSRDILKGAYSDEFKDDQVIFVPGQVPLMAAAMGTYEREKPGGNFIMGALYWETIILAEAGARAGAMQVGGTGRLYQVPYVVALCDYCLIGEELLAAGAYISKEPAQLGTILGSDIVRFLVVGLIGLVILGSVVGFDVASKIFRF